MLILTHIPLNAAFDTTVVAWGYPEEEDLDEALNLTSWIENETARDMLIHYLVLCPEQDMCLGPLFRRNYTFSETPACTTCDCDDSCVRKATCCPSKFYRQTNSPDFIEYHNISKPEEKVVPLSCIEPLWNTEGIKSGKSYWMVKTCPNGTECLNVSLAAANITNYTPVTSIDTNETYVNVYCAFCNQELMSNVIFWEQKNICLQRSALFNTDTEFLFRSIFGLYPECNIGFYPPESLQAMAQSCQGNLFHHSCTDNILPNNRMRAYLTQACQKYYLPYSKLGIVYKNIFCALCENDLVDLSIENNPNHFFVDPLNGVVFSGLLNFHQTKPQATTRSTECKENQLLDKTLVEFCYFNGFFFKQMIFFLFIHVYSRRNYIFDIVAFYLLSK